MSNKTYFYKRAGSQEVGPLTAAQLRRDANKGALAPEMLVRATGQSNWVCAQNVKGLFAHVAPIGKQVAIANNLFGRLVVKYDCPKCDVRLTSPIREAGQVDVCPECGCKFAVPGSERRKAVERDEVELKRQRKQLAIERRAEKETSKKRRSEQRAAEELRRSTERAKKQKLLEEKTESEQQVHLEQEAESERSVVSPNDQHLPTSPSKNSTRIGIAVSFTAAVFILCFRFFCGVFVIQPIGAIPEGATIIYFRSGLNLPFVASADGVLEDSGAGVSLLGRGVMLATLAEPIKEREIIRFRYSKLLYLWSTGGKEYDR